MSDVIPPPVHDASMEAASVPKASHQGRVAVVVVMTVFIALGALTSAMPPTDPLAVKNYSYDDTVAPGPNPMDTGDTAWILISAALVLFMTPGVGFFYGGMVTHKNIVSTIYQTYVGMGIVSILWVIIGFSLAFGVDANGSGVMGSPATFYMFNGVGANTHPDLCGTIPLTIFAMFQLMFAIITPILISGSMAERVNFNSWLIFLVFWHLLVYCPLAHITWAPGGALREWGVIDFAGGIPVEMGSGFSSLACAVFVGPRRGSEVKRTANIPFVLLGTAILWFGWFGFNAGSSLGANGLAAQTFVNTNTCAATAMITWLFLDILLRGCSSAVGACNGVLVGLVAITPSGGFVTAGSSIVIGIVACFVCYFTGVFMKERSGVDDTLDVFTIHGVAGLVGFILTGVFCSLDINSGGFDGLVYGEGITLAKHIAATLVLIPFYLIATYACCFIANLIIPLRVSSEEEELGLDISMHNESMNAMEAKPEEGTEKA